MTWSQPTFDPFMAAQQASPIGAGQPNAMAQPHAQAMISPFATPYPQQGAVNRAGGEKGLSRSGGIKTRPIPPQFKFPPVPRYSGETDPKEFLSIYESAIEAAHGDKNTKAKVIHLALDGIARSWYFNLPANSIYSWEQLRDVFVLNFRGTYEEPKTQQHLLGIRQRLGESIREYMRRFSQARCQVQDITEASVINAASASLLEGELTRKIANKEPQMLEHLLRIIDGFARGEEDSKRRQAIQAEYDKAFVAAAQAQQQVQVVKPPPLVVRQPQPAIQAQPPRQGQAPMTWRKFRTDRAGKAVMAVEEVQALRKEFDAQQASNHQQPVRKKVRKDLYCTFHGRSSHTTEQCRNIRQRGNAQDPRTQQGAVAEATREIAQEQAPPTEQRQDAQRRVIQVITRVDPPIQLSKRQKKMQLRTVHNITLAGEGTPQYLNQQIFFGPEDVEGVMFPHQDPLVISIEIAGFEVIFAEAYAKMGLTTQALTPAPTSLRGFSGEAVQVLGQAQLIVAFGTGENRREEQVLFDIVDIPYNYNAIFGRATLNKFEAISHHNYLKLKMYGPAGVIVAGVIQVIDHPEWLANPVLVRKSNGKWRMCVDFTNLNKACPKDDFPLPRIDQLVDSTAGCELMSFLDAYSGYHQIRMNPASIPKTALITPFGTFCHLRMPFGLRNAGATFARLVYKVLYKQLGRNVEAYVDDIVVKSRKAFDHASDLQETFDNLRAAGMKLNPEKCVFGVRAGKLLGFLVSERGIEANPEKIDATQQMKPPSSVREVQKLTGQIAALSRFLSKAAERVAVSAALVQETDSGQKPVYFVSEALQGAKTRYIEIEKLAYALVMTSRKLKHYFQAHKVIVKYSGVKKLLAGLAKYEAILLGLRKAKALGIRRLLIRTDSKLVAGHVDKSFEAKEEGMKRSNWAKTHTTGEPPFVKHLETGWLPVDEAEAKRLQFRATKYKMVSGQLYRSGILQPLLRCISFAEGEEMAKEIHQGLCGAHQAARTVASKVFRQGVYWPTVLKFITNNGKQFDSDKFREMCEGLNLEIRFASVAHLQSNGAAERTNGKILEALKKRPTKFSPFMLLYDDEAMTPTVLGANSPRVTFSGGEEGRELSLKLLEGVRVEALEHMQKYATSTSATYNKKVRPTEPLPGHLVLRKKANPIAIGKLESKWEGPYLIKHKSRMGSFQLATLEGEEFDHSWNAASLKRFYV
nr:retrotransposon protein, putative, Ty3-gypsy sub-class [Oryza sativa Japonica Group]